MDRATGVGVEHEIVAIGVVVADKDSFGGEVLKFSTVLGGNVGIARTSENS